jgi:uncharacterized damage-inducible protein DinB
MKMRLPACLALAACFAPFALAQSIANPITSTVKQIMARSEHNMVSAAKLMPADKYTYRPTPAQWTFRHLIKHATSANYFFCSKLTGAAMPAAAQGIMSANPPKNVLVSHLQASYAWCQSRFAAETDAGLSDPIHLFGPHTMSRGGGMVIMTDDWTDHYAQAASYLRLNGILPPTAHKKM